MEEKTKDQNPETLEELVRENMRLTQEIHRMSKRVNRYVTIQNILSVVYFLLIVVPLIVGAIYLPFFLKSYLSPYAELLNDNRQAIDSVGNYDSGKITDIIDQAQKMINNQTK